MILPTCRKPSVYLQAKKNFTLHALLEILQRYANFLFWAIWACLVELTQNDSINLCKTFMFICMQKKLHHSLYCWDITFKESCNLIGCSNLRTRIWDWWWNINNNISFHFRLLPRKTNHKSFLKIQKERILGQFWVLFT